MTTRRLTAATRIAALGAAGVAALGVSLPTAAQGYGSLAEGRAVFDRLGCNACHSYVSRRVAPSIRDLMRDFSGDPVAIASATRTNSAHKEDPQFPTVSEADLRSVSEWLGGISWPEPVVAEAPALPAQPTAPTPDEVPAVIAVPTGIIGAPEPAAPQLIAPAAIPSVAVESIRLEKGKARTDRLVIEMSGGEPDLVDLQMRDEQLLVSVAGARLGTKIPGHRANWPGSRVVAAVDAVDRGGSVDLTISSRVAAWTYTGMQGKRRMIIDLTADAKQPVVKKAVTAKLAKAPPPSPKAKPAKPAQAVAKAAAPAAKAASATASAAATTTSAAAAIAAAPSAAAPSPSPAPVVAAAPVTTPPTASKAPEPPPVQIALAKPEADAPPVAAPAKRKTNLKYRDGSDLKPCPPASAEEQVIGSFDVDAVKEILDRVGCPQCHAYVQKKTGPPFRDVIKKYKGDPACVIHRLKTNPTHKDEGVTKDIQAHEFKQIADYVATRIK